MQINLCEGSCEGGCEGGYEGGSEGGCEGVRESGHPRKTKRSDRHSACKGFIC